MMIKKQYNALIASCSWENIAMIAETLQKEKEYKKLVSILIHSCKQNH